MVECACATKKKIKSGLGDKQSSELTMADIEEKRLLNSGATISANTPDYDAIFNNERKHSQFAQKTALGQVSPVQLASHLTQVYGLISDILCSFGTPRDSYG